MASGEPRSTEFLMQAIGKAVQRGNAASVLGTVCKGQHLSYIIYNVSSLLVCFSEVV